MPGQSRLPFPASFLVPLLIAATSCDRSEIGPGPIRAENGGTSPGAGVEAVAAGEPEPSWARRQTIYVPAYSAVATANNSRLYQLAITLGIRNTDRDHPITETSVGYNNQEGKRIRDFLGTPLRIRPLASMELFVREGDTTGGTAASFLVDWGAEQAVSDPVVEAIMVGTVGSQGISFTCPGRVIADRGR
jgi:hypothetical protein